MYEIETGIPFPTKKTRRSKIMELPFEKLEVGQSFHIANVDKDETSKLSAWCQLAGKRLERRFGLRTATKDDPKGPGVRIWRVEDKPQNLDSLFAGKETKGAATKPQAEKVAAPARGRKRAAEPRAFDAPKQNRRQNKAAGKSPWSDRAHA